MMKTIGVTLLTICGWAQYASAQQVAVPAPPVFQELLEVRSDVTGNDLYKIGIYTDSKNKVSHFYYHLDQAKKKAYPIKDMEDGMTLYEERGMSVITLDVDPVAVTGMYRLNFRYLYNAISPFNRRRSTLGWLKYDRRLGRYQMYSANDQGRPDQVVSSIFVEGHRIARQLVGIYSIKLQ
jgi:hypothetical protein